MTDTIDWTGFEMATQVDRKGSTAMTFKHADGRKRVVDVQTYRDPLGLCICYEWGWSEPCGSLVPAYAPEGFAVVGL